MKKLTYPLAFILIPFLFLHSCSAEKDEINSTPSIQNANTETELTQYTLKVSAGEGGIVSTVGGTYNEGTKISIIATPNEDYDFIGWEGSNSLETSIVVDLNSSISLRALFRKLELIKIQLLSPPDTLLVTQDYTPNVLKTLDDGTTKEISQLVKISSQNNRVTILNNTIMGAIGGDEVLAVSYTHLRAHET